MSALDSISMSVAEHRASIPHTPLQFHNVEYQLTEPQEYR